MLRQADVARLANRWARALGRRSRREGGNSRLHQSSPCGGVTCRLSSCCARSLRSGPPGKVMHLALPNVGRTEVESFTRKQQEIITADLQLSHENFYIPATCRG